LHFEFTTVAGALALELVVALVVVALVVVALVVVALVVVALVVVALVVLVLVLVLVGVVADCEPHAPSVAASPMASPAAAIREPRRCRCAAGDRPRRNTAGSVAVRVPLVVVLLVASRGRRAA
jgi:hypothetical protein